MARAGTTRGGRVITMLLRWPVFIPLALVVAGGLWVGTGAWLTRRTVAFDITPEQTGHWALEWQRTGGQTNGVWLDLVDYCTEPETLEIRPSGNVDGSGANTELWLYEVVPLRPGRGPIDLKESLRKAVADDLRGHWVPFEAGPGIVYSDAGPGLLRLTVPAGGVTLRMAKTDTSARAVFTYADDTEQVDMRAAKTEPLELDLRRKSAPAGRTLHVSRGLPHYPIAGLTLRWGDAATTALSISNPVLVQRLFGVRVKTKALRLSGDGCQPAGKDKPTEFEVKSAAPAGTLVFQGGTDVGRTVTVIGVAGLWLILLAARMVGELAIRAGRLIRSWGGVLDCAAGIVVVTVHVGLAAWAPPMLTPDSLDYVGDAAAIVDTGSFSHIGGYRTPGYAVFAAPFLQLFHDFASALGYAQAVLGILTTYCVYRIARAFLPRPWPALALLLIGLDPVLLTYERYALTECLTTFCVALASWLFVWQYRRYRAAPPGVGGVLVGALILGLVCGLSAYVRPNLQMLIVLLPPALAWVCWHRGARGRVLAQAALTLVVAVACISPWLLRNQALYGRPALALAAQANRAGGLYNFGALDIDQTAVFSYDRWQELRRKYVAGQLSVYDAAGAIVTSPAIQRPEGQSPVVHDEEVYRQAASEAVARCPEKALHSMAVALASQLYLWPKFDHPSASENMYWSGALRGEAMEGTTNFPRLPAQHWNLERLRSLQERSARDITYLRGNAVARAFNELYWAYRQARPIIALLFLIGLVASFAARAYPLTVIGLLTLGNAVALAVLVYSPIDRYSAPFLPVMSLLAVYTLSRLGPRTLDPRRTAT